MACGSTRNLQVSDDDEETTSKINYKPCLPIMNERGRPAFLEGERGQVEKKVQSDRRQGQEKTGEERDKSSRTAVLIGACCRTGPGGPHMRHASERGCGVWGTAADLALRRVFVLGWHRQCSVGLYGSCAAYVQGVSSAAETDRTGLVGQPPTHPPTCLVRMPRDLRARPKWIVKFPAGQAADALH